MACGEAGPPGGPRSRKAGSAGVGREMPGACRTRFHLRLPSRRRGLPAGSVHRRGPPEGIAMTYTIAA